MQIVTRKPPGRYGSQATDFSRWWLTMFTGKNRMKTLTSKTKKYYSFSSVYFTPKGKDGYWSYDSHAIDSKTGHVYHFISIGSAGGK